MHGNMDLYALNQREKTVTAQIKQYEHNSLHSIDSGQMPFPTLFFSFKHTYTPAVYFCFHSIIYTDENAPGPCTLDITALFKEFTTTSVVEAAPDFLEIPHQGRDGHGRAAADSSTSATLNCREGSEECNIKGKIDKFLIELYPLQLKILILTLS